MLSHKIQFALQFTSVSDKYLISTYLNKFSIKFDRAVVKLHRVNKSNHVSYILVYDTITTYYSSATKLSNMS